MIDAKVLEGVKVLIATYGRLTCGVLAGKMRMPPSSMVYFLRDAVGAGVLTECNGARALFCVSVNGRSFKGICFSASARPFAPELWTVQRAVTGWSCEPRRSRIPKALRAQAAELAELWAENVPRTRADFTPGLNAMGLDFSVTLFGSFTRFRLGDVVYIETGMKPAAHMTEILSDEFYAAKKQVEASS